MLEEIRIDSSLGFKPSADYVSSLVKWVTSYLLTTKRFSNWIMSDSLQFSSRFGAVNEWGKNGKYTLYVV